MLIVISVIFILLSSFVGASSLGDNSKTGYFIVASLIFVLLTIVSFLWLSA